MSEQADIIKNNIKEWNNITFKSKTYGYTHDTINPNDQFIFEHEGVITMTRIEDNLPPLIIGEFGFSIWNFDMARELGGNLSDHLKLKQVNDSYIEMKKCIANGDLYVHDSESLIVVHNLLIHPKFRKKGIADEFVEYLYKNYLNSATRIIFLVKPLQENEMDYEYYFEQKTIKFRENIGVGSSYRILPASKYYALSTLIDDKDDDEINHYKLFAIASRCGFRRLGESFLFIFTPDKMKERIALKKKYL